MLKTRLVIADRSLRDERGHHYSLTRTVTDGARQLGVDVIWFVNREFRPSLEPDDVTVRRTFSTSMYDPATPVVVAGPGPRQASIWRGGFRELLRRIRASVAYRWAKFRGKRPPAEAVSTPEISAHIALAEELLAAVRADELGPDDHVLIHSADGDMYRAVLNVVLAHAREQLPVLHIATPYDAATMPHYARGVSVERIVHYLELLRVLGTRIFLYGENAQLAEHLATQWGVDVASLGIPLPQGFSSPQADGPGNDGLHVVYLGAAREEKGFLSLPGVVARCVERTSGCPVFFTIQCTEQIVGYTKPIQAAIEKLAAFDPEFVTLIRSEQPMREYYALLERADVVIACYDREKYRFRGSGVAAEAVAFGNTVIVTPHTSPEAIAAEAGIAASGAESISAAILGIAARKQEFADRANARRARYLAENAPEQYVRNLLCVPASVASANAEAPRDGARASTADRAGPPVDWRELLAAEFDPDRARAEHPVSRKLLGRETALD